MRFVLGVTGGIGTGKSTVLGILARLGAETLSADDIAREVLAKGTPAYHETVARFGDGILASDGEIDRSGLASIVFDDPQARAALNDITHPRIIARLKSLIDQFRSQETEHPSVLAVEIPLLMECGLEGLVDEVLLVAAEQQTQVSRLTSRSNVSCDEALRRIGAQMPMEEKIRRADRVVWNDGNLSSLEESIRLLWGEYRLL